MLSYRGTFLGVAKRLRVAFGIDGDISGELHRGVQPVALAEDLTDHRYLYPKGGSSFEASGEVGQDGARYNGFLLLPAVSPIDPAKIQRIIRITSLSFWTTVNNSGGIMIGWGVYDRNQAIPALADGSIHVPTRRDARQAFDASLYTLQSGLIAGSNNAAPFSSTRRWARMWTTGTPGAVPAPRFDPRITLRTGDFLYIMSSLNNSAWAISIAWDEIPCSDQENAGDTQ